MTTDGGLSNVGTIFEYDYISNVYSHKLDLNNTIGRLPIYSSLIEVCQFINLVSGIPNYTYCSNNNASISFPVTGSNLSFQWYKNNTAISGAINDTLSINNISLQDSGIFYCQINNGCRSLNTNTFSIGVSPCLSINELEINLLSNLPTFFNQKIEINNLNNVMKKITLSDLSGKVLYQEDNVSNHNLLINTEDLPQGVYIIKISRGFSNSAKKLIKIDK